MNQGIQNLNKYKLLDWESIRSSPRDGSSISYLWVGLVVVVGWVVDPQDFCVSPGLLKMVHPVRLMMLSLKMVDYSMSFLLLST